MNPTENCTLLSAASLYFTHLRNRQGGRMPRRKIAKVCEYCHQDFMASSARTRFCSYKCAGRAMFWSKVEKTDCCWIWKGCLEKTGRYGASTRRVDGKRVGSQIAHKIAYEELVGPVPEGKVLDHLCRNMLCVRPDHLEPVTDLVNLERGEIPWMRRRRAGVCKRGHPLTPENTRVRISGGKTKRECLLCVRLWRKDYRKRTGH
jgi:hypothetical protein